MYRVSLAVSPIDLCHAINVSSEWNPRRGRAGERAREGSAWKIHAPWETRSIASCLREIQKETNDKTRTSIAKGAAYRLKGNVSELSSFLLDGARKIGHGEKKKKAAENRGKVIRQTWRAWSGRHTSFKATLCPTHSGTRISSLARVEIADRSSDFSGWKAGSINSRERVVNACLPSRFAMENL